MLSTFFSTKFEGHSSHIREMEGLQDQPFRRNMGSCFELPLNELAPEFFSSKQSEFHGIEFSKEQPKGAFIQL